MTGGQRSGKSQFAESLALQYSDNPVYLATARIYDDEMKERVRLHKNRREKNWINIEEPLNITIHSDLIAGKTVLVDCITMLATNFFFDCNEDGALTYKRLSQELDSFMNIPDSTIIFVTNEIGLGGIGANHIQRKFGDIQGSINQFIAKHADEVFFLISGIPLKIKP